MSTGNLLYRISRILCPSCGKYFDPAAARWKFTSIKSSLFSIKLVCPNCRAILEPGEKEKLKGKIFVVTSVFLLPAIYYFTDVNENIAIALLLCIAVIIHGLFLINARKYKIFKKSTSPPTKKITEKVFQNYHKPETEYLNKFQYRFKSNDIFASGGLISFIIFIGGSAALFISSIYNKEHGLLLQFLGIALFLIYSLGYLVTRKKPVIEINEKGLCNIAGGDRTCILWKDVSKIIESRTFILLKGTEKK